MPKNELQHIALVGRDDAIAQRSKAPYFSLEKFAVATNGFFKNKEELEQAWNHYQITINSKSSEPAILYKIAEYKSASFDYHYESDLKMNGRILVGAHSRHTWQVNLSWMLAQIHQRRPFLLFSDLTPINVRHRGTFYSALAFFSPSLVQYFFEFLLKILNKKDLVPPYSVLAQQVAVAYKVGYEVRIDRESNVTLVPPSISASQKVTLQDLQVTEADIHAAVSFVYEKQVLVRNRARL